MRFDKKTALVSGAGGPMGGAVARRLASEGADLLITDISGRRLEANAEKLRAEFPDRKIVAHRASVLNFSEVQDLAKQAPAPIDLIANIVGGIRGAFEIPLLEMTDERWTDTFDLNVKGIIYLAREIGPGMRERRYGRIVNISSVAYAGDGRQPDYAAAKAAVVSLTRSMAMELAPHVTVNCIAPGVIATSVTEYADPAFLQTWIDRSLLKRLGKPEDIASVSAFLLSDDASYLTGVMLPVSGGIWPSL
jgi:NAD(P)-dependent dehydrogenase (short-subunit alcohol dehydrogenase family)